MIENAEEWADGTEPQTGPVLNSDASNATDESAVKSEEEDIDDLTIQHVDSFLSDHDRPSTSELEDLAQQQTPEAREALVSLAEEYDVSVDDATSPRDIAEKVRQAMDSSEDMVY